jgi:murein DD-endopeptidase MepM/ murein hydrolase activator NlpD
VAIYSILEVKFLNKDKPYLRKRLKHILIPLILVSSLAFFISSASAEEETDVFLIFVNDKYIGTVNNKKIVDELAQEKTKKAEQKFENASLTTAPIHVVSNQTFHPQSDNERTLKRLDETLPVLMEGYALTIDGKEVAYLKSKEDAMKAVENLKKNYVSEETLNRLEKERPVQEKDMSIFEVSLSKDVSYLQKTIHPEEVLTSGQATNLLEKGTLANKQYMVQTGDTIGEIADRYDCTIDNLLEWNPELEEESKIKPGDRIHIQENEPLVDVIVKAEKIEKEQVPFETETIKDSSLPKGEKIVHEKGEMGEKESTYSLIFENGKETNKETKDETVLKEPVKEKITIGTKIIPDKGTGNLEWPAAGGYVSSKLGQRWGKMHKGIDIARPDSYEIKAADNGRVVSAGVEGGYGNKVTIDHNNGMKTVYAHLKSIDVSTGDVVSKGQKIGVMGSTGHSTGTHLHFEVYKNGKLKDPLKYVKQ